MASIRKDDLENGEIYHIFNKSISHYKIFNNHREISKIIETVRYYQVESPPYRLSRIHSFPQKIQNDLFESVIENKKNRLVEIVCYCIMPTHMHFVLKQLKDNGISIFMNNISNSYSRYFNILHDRKGPLWVNRFKNILIQSDEQLLHLSRYIHINPTTAYLVNKPEDWEYSSYNEYINDNFEKICDYDGLISLSPIKYKEFVEDRIDYQQQLLKIKDMLIE